MLKKRLNSFRYAFAGIKRLFTTEPNAWIHLFAAFSVVVAGFYFQISNTEWCLVVLAIATVLMAEAFNTAVENLTDLVAPEHHPLAGHAKDTAAAAVLLVAIGSAIIGTIIFLPKIIAVF